MSSRINLLGVLLPRPPWSFGKVLAVAFFWGGLAGETTLALADVWAPWVDTEALGGIIFVRLLLLLPLACVCGLLFWAATRSIAISLVSAVFNLVSLIVLSIVIPASQDVATNLFALTDMTGSGLHVRTKIFGGLTATVAFLTIGMIGGIVLSLRKSRRFFAGAIGGILAGLIAGWIADHIHLTTTFISCDPLQAYWGFVSFGISSAVCIIGITFASRIGAQDITADDQEEGRNEPEDRQDK